MLLTQMPPVGVLGANGKWVKKLTPQEDGGLYGVF